MRKVFFIILSFLIVLGIGAISSFAFFDIYDFYLRNRYPLAYEDYINKYSAEFSLDPALIGSVIYEESRFRSGSISEKGAMGLMQILPETAVYIAEKTHDLYFDTKNLNNEETNIKYGCYYLSYLFHKYDDLDKVLAAYNAGEGNVDKWIEEGKFEIKFTETSNFVERVIRSKAIYEKLYFAE